MSRVGIVLELEVPIVCSILDNSAPTPTTMFGRRKILAILISLLAAIALGVSSYLTWATWDSGTVAGCTGEAVFECDEVLGSRWSKWLGLPVSLLGALSYVGILALVWPAAGQARGTAATLLFGVAMLAAGAAAWFTGLQFLEVQSFCPYCLAVHACGVVISGLALWLFLDGTGSGRVEQARNLLGVVNVDDMPVDDEPAEPVSMASLMTAMGIAAVGLVALMAGQLLVEPAETMAMEELNFDTIEQDSATEPEQEVELADSAETVVEPEPVELKPADPSDDETQLAADKTLESSNEQDDTDWLDGEAESMPAELLETPTTIDSIFGADQNLTPGKIAFKALKEPIDPNDMPVLGNPDAPHIVVEMMDYTCRHCRELHPHLEAAVERYGYELGVAIYNVPLSKKCNPQVKKDYPGKKNACEYAQLAIGVWKLAPEEFAEFHHWLLEGKKPPSIVKAKQRARRLVGNAILRDQSLKADAARRITKQIDDFQRLKTGLPVLLLPNNGLRGVPKTSEEFFKFLEANLDMQPPS